MKKSFILGCIMLPMAAFADIIADAQSQLQATRIICDGISDDLSRVSGVAKTDSAITAIGTVAGGGAVYAGFKKLKWDQEIETLMDKMCAGGGCSANAIKSMSDDDFVENVLTPMADMSKLADEIANAEKKSKKLGNWRTGLMAGNAATNIASSIIAGLNKNQSDLVQHIIACNNSLSDLNSAYYNLLDAGINPYENPIMTKIVKIRDNCGEISSKDIAEIEQSMSRTMEIGIAGGAIGVAGTAVSATANSDKTRNNNSEKGQQKEEKLNFTANILGVVSTGSSVLGTVSNISTVSTIKKLIKRAQYCEEALQ